MRTLCLLYDSIIVDGLDDNAHSSQCPQHLQAIVSSEITNTPLLVLSQRQEVLRNTLE